VWAAVLVVVAVVLAGACNTTKGLFNADLALRRDGFGGVNVSFRSTNGEERVLVRASSGPVEKGDVDLEAARVIWTTFPFRFDQIEVKVGSSPVRVFFPVDLERQFGPRPAGYDDHTIKYDVVHSARTIGLIVGIAGLIVVAGVVLTIVVVVRHRRMRPPQPWYGPPGQPGWPQQPGQQAWPPQAGPQGWPQQPQQPGQQGWPPQPGPQGWPPQPGPPPQPAWPPPPEPDEPPS
jgi:hypothetical protein